ncbi:MAG: hypothetical protein DRN99_04410 [Thermoproteota archaeon]|nr:MAG: hypothetical protein DRN99_04410 [Candidatus Korarchaeota archaeon]
MRQRLQYSASFLKASSPHYPPLYTLLGSLKHLPNATLSRCLQLYHELHEVQALKEGAEAGVLTLTLMLHSP